MSHWSLNATRLDQVTIGCRTVAALQKHREETPQVNLLWLPADRMVEPTARNEKTRDAILRWAAQLHPESVLCVLTAAPDAACLLGRLTLALKFQLWIAPKQRTAQTFGGAPSNRHAALLVLSRYQGSLRHTTTRIAYTYCPACGKTTKDYGGKKHTYHEYGTLMSDVWRDIAIDTERDIGPAVDRLCDLFGLSPYKMLRIFDLRGCAELKSSRRPGIFPTANGHSERSAKSGFDNREISDAEDRIPRSTRNNNGRGTNSGDQHAAPSPPSDGLMNSDCLKALREISANSIDYCFADPPYNIRKNYDHWNDALEIKDYFNWCDEWLGELARVIRPGHTITIINIPLFAARHFQFLATKLAFQCWIAWEALSLPVRMIMPAHYAVLCFSKGAPRPLPGLQAETLSPPDREILAPLKEFFCVRSACLKRRGAEDREPLSDLWHDIHRLKHNSRRVDHPCQLPPALMRRLFALFTRENETILDCFNGAGTSTLVAAQMGRRFVGIELSPEYHQLALRRHARSADGHDPFAKTARLPQAKNSRVQRLPRQKYAVSKKTLQLDVKRIARRLGRLPTRAEVAAHSRYPIEYFEKYFISWGEVCAAARTTGMSEMPRPTAAEPIQLTMAFEASRQS